MEKSLLTTNSPAVAEPSAMDSPPIGNLNALLQEHDRIAEDFRDLFDEAPISYILETLDSRFIRANKAAINLLGLKPEEVAGTYGKSFLADTHENWRRLDDALAAVSEGKQSDRVELELRRRDNGKPVWVQWWSRPAPGGDYMRSVLLDITERVLMEQAKTALEFTLESGQVGDWDLDVATDTSRRSLRHDQCFGYPEGHPGPWGREDFIQHTHPEDRLDVERSFLAAIDTRTAWDAEFRVLWPDTTVHWVSARGEAYTTVEGRTTRMRGIVMDITRRKQSEEMLRATQAVLEFTLDSGRIGDWDLDLLHDTSRRSLRHDQCFGYGFPIPNAEWGVEVFVRHIHPEDRIRVESGLRNAAKELTDWESEFRVIWPDETLHWLEARGRIYRTSEGVATRMLGIVMDITERKRSEDALRVAEHLVRGQRDALTHTLEALAAESSPDKFLQHVLSTIGEQLGATSCIVWNLRDQSAKFDQDCIFENGLLTVNPLGARSEHRSFINAVTHQALAKTLQKSRFHILQHSDLESSAYPAVSASTETLLCVSMTIAAKVEGAIGICFNTQRNFRSEEIELAQALANQAMLAIELGRLASQSSRSAVLAERNRLARDIHDTLAQGFTGVIVQLEASAEAMSKGLAEESIKHSNRAASLARESLSEARRSLNALRPEILEKTDLSQALGALIQEMTVTTKIQGNFKRNGDLTIQRNDWDDHLLRISQEFVNNTIHHAHAQCLSIELTLAEDTITLELKDDGIGFNVEGQYKGFGLLGIRERVDAMGGEFTIASTRDSGTKMVVRLSG